MAPLDEPRDYQDVTRRKKVQFISPTTLFREGRHSLMTATGNVDTSGFDDTPAHESPAIDIDSVITQVNLKVAYDEESYISYLSIDQQATWVIPAIHNATKSLEIESKHIEAEGYLSYIRNLIKSSGIYALGSLASPLISLGLTPFLTRTLSHADYGALAVLNSAIAFVAGITQLGLSSAFFRMYNYNYNSQRDRLHVLSATVILLSLISIPTTVAMMITASGLATLLFGSPSLRESVMLANLIILLQNLTVPGLSWLRADNRAVFSSILSIANVLITLCATLILMGVLHMGINGSLIAIGAGYAIIVVCTLPVILLRAGLRLRFEVTRDLIFFGVPITLSFVSIWVLQLSDRYLLSYFGSLAQVAGYTVAYSLGGVLYPLLLGPFGLAWPPMMYAIAKRENAAHIFRMVFRWFSIVLLFAVFALSLLSIGALDILFPPAYHSAAPIIPVIALSMMFYGIYQLFAIGAYVRGKTSFIAIFTTAAALINVGFNIFLIPHYGSMGAAASTLLAYAFLALIAYVVNQRIYPIPFEIGMFIVALFIGVALYVGSSFLAQTQEVYIGWGISLGALTIYGACLTSLGKLSAKSHKNTD